MKRGRVYLNDGILFQSARIVERAGGVMRECIIDASQSDANTLTYWESGSYFQTSVNTSELQVMDDSLKGIDMYLLPLCLVEDLPQEGTFYNEVSKGTGGIGKHPRMEIQFPNGDLEMETTLFVTLAKERQVAFEKLLQDSDFIVTNITCRTYYLIPGEDLSIGTMVTVKKRANVVALICIFAWHGFVARGVEKDDFKIVAFMPDKLSRAQMMWPKQFEADPANVGPVRDGYRFRPHSFKEGWQSVYSYQGYAREIRRDLIGETISEFPDIDVILKHLDDLTFPICAYVIEQIQLHVKKLLGQLEQASLSNSAPVCSSGVTWSTGIDHLRQKLEDTDEILGKLEINKDVPALTWEQMQHVNKVTYAAEYGPYSDDHKKRLRHVCLLYAIHGTVGRIAGNYEKSGRYRGLSDDLRIFQGESAQQLQEAYENGDTSVLPASAINRLRTSDGKLKGTGGRGYKGIHSATRKPTKTYNPKWSMKRTIKVDEEARDVQNSVDFVNLVKK